MTKVLVFILMMLLVAPAALAVTINEIRIDNVGTDTDEYFELAGDPGESLDGLTYIVIGDGTGGSGVIESVTDLTGQALQADGLLSVHNSNGAAGTCAVYDVELPMAFENSDNVTHLLVSGFTGALGDDLDVDEDGNLDSTPWASEVDCVALIEDLAAGELVYCATQVGPDDVFVPGHIFWCDGFWAIGDFDPVCTHDTPGDPNDPSCAVPTEDSSWSGVKGLYR